MWNIVTMFYLIWIGASPLPFGDQWDTSLLPGESIHHFFGFHNEHRPALARLMGLLDWYLDDARNGVTESFIALCFPIFGLGLFGLLKSVINEWRRPAVYAGLATAIAFSGYQFENLLWGFQTAFVGSFVFGLLALVFAVLAVDSSRSVEWRVVCGGLCFVACGFAVFSLASGLLVLLFVTGLLFLANAPARLRYGYATFAAAIIGFYFYGYSSANPHDSPAVAIWHVWGIAHYLLVYLGAPFSGGSLARATGIGALGLLLISVVVVEEAVVAFWSGRSSAIVRNAGYLALMLFCVFLVSAGLLTAVGRLKFGLSQAMSSRYGTPALMFWSGLVCLYLVQPDLKKAVRPKLAQMFGLVGGAALAFYVATSQPRYFATAHLLRASKLQGAIAYVVGLRAYPAMLQLYPNMGALKSHHLDVPMKRLRDANKSIFSQQWPFMVGKHLSNWKELRSSKGCIGHIDERKPIMDAAAEPPDIPREELRGWAWDNSESEVPDLVLITNAEGVIVGFGGPGDQRADVARALPSVTSEYTGWVGFVQASPTATLRAYALFLGKAGRVCQFAVSRGR